jgi:predicted  nucleic acid-binding Zn-ribbon protein
MKKNTLIGAGAAILAAGVLGIGGASLASADDAATSAAANIPTATATNGTSRSTQTAPDPSKPMRSDETLLTGTTKDKVTAAAKAKEPTATIQRVETDSDGVYEAHMVRTDGTQIIVQVDKDFAVTGVQEMGAGGPGGHRGGPQGQAPTGSSTSSSSSSSANG